MADTQKALVLLVHGSKDPAWMRPFQEMAEEVSKKAPQLRVEIACLQFCEPALSQVIEKLYKDGVTKVTVVPVFISSLGHVQKDVPTQVEKAREAFPDVKIGLSPALGELGKVKQAFIQALSILATGQ